MRTTTLSTLAAALLLAACSNASKGLSVSATTRGATSTTPSGAAGAAVASIDAGNGLSIDRLRLLVRQVEVEGDAACAAAGPSGPSGATGPTGPSGPSGTARMAAGGPALADHGGDGGMSGDGSGDGDGEGSGHGDCEIEGGPFLVDLAGAALTGGVHWVAGITLPAGTYDEIKFKIDTLPAAPAGDAGLQAMVDAHASIIVDGSLTTTVAGVLVITPFSFSTGLSVSQKREGAIVVDPATGANVTLDVDPSGWFKAADGTLLDPASPTALGAILENVRASIRVLKDDDGDGHDDDGHDGTH